MTKAKKQKVSVIPEWMKQIDVNQRSDSECHNTRHRAEHDIDDKDGTCLKVNKRSTKLENKELEDRDSRARARPAAPDRSKLAARREAKKLKSKEVRAKTKAAKKEPAGTVAAAALDKKSRWSSAPSEMYEVKGAEREEQLALLSRRTKEQKELKRALGAGFMTAYKRYRVKITPGYNPMQSEFKIAEDAGAITFMRGLTPGRVIAYWHSHVGDFTSLTAVPLRFLASPGNIDQVALVAPDDSRGTAESRAKGKSAGARIHAYGDPRALDSRLRNVLVENGFDCSGFSDRELLSIQNAARAKATGRKMFVGKSLSEMVACAAVELYSEED